MYQVVYDKGDQLTALGSENQRFFYRRLLGLGLKVGVLGCV